MIETERDLFIQRLREFYHLERELEDLQTELAEAATDEELESFYMAHSETTTEQIDRIEPLFDAVEAEPGVVESDVLDTLTSEREDLIADVQDPALGDLVEAELGRTIERLEITKLETLLALADRMDLPSEIVEPLEQTKTEATNGLERAKEVTEI
ncbi:DUF892 family protein [Natrialba sp. SSL1]|uniref:DUF892 family protein n=1 Tax=Natrialba sp. SSL1 TaxID=1869245 RepID=UPI000A03ABC1|nr:DUF892 family protein [Natrialba sp. SSL1]